MSSPRLAAKVLFPSEELRLAPVEGTGGMVQIVIHDSGASYILKCFDPDHGSLVEREIGMRTCLRRCTDIAFPEVLDLAELNGERYLLMEYVEGDSLLDLWRDDPARVPDEMSRLGMIMGEIHAIPLEAAEQILDEDPSIYTAGFFAGMAAALGPYLSLKQQAALSICYRRVTGESLEQVVVHGDFGPNQVIVRPDGGWVLYDFEFAMIGPFADDLGGSEVRMERFGFMDTQPFLAGYNQIHSRRAAYEPVRDAFMAYLLLTVLSTAITRDGDTLSTTDVDRLRQLLERVA